MQDKEAITSHNSEWTQKLQYSRSFMAKLILSDKSVKEFYAAITAKLLSYKKIRSHTGWSGVSFFCGRDIIAKITIGGKTLRVYLALSPSAASGVKYKAKDVSNVRKYQKTPSLYKIKSQGALNHCLKIIDTLAQEFDLTLREDTPSVITSSFKQDSFSNLVTRGLIKLLKGKTSATSDEQDQTQVADLDESGVLGAYEDVDSVTTELIGKYKIFGDILSAMSSGEAKTRLSTAYMLRSIDENWINAVEQTLPALDELIRNPSHFIDETEEVLPIEMTKKITSRSVVHLSQHTDLISKVEDDTVTPTKMLNIFREDSLFTYENKFLNTLIYKLYIFVNKRYNTALNFGVDEKVTSIDFEDRFYHDDYKAKIKISVSVSSKSDGGDREESQKINRITQSELWQRVEKLNGIVSTYRSSSFCAAMGSRYVKPPVMRTNAILKNKYFRTCLALWEFIESYDDDGLGVTVDETVLVTPQEYVKQLYEQSAIAYFVFRHNAFGDYNTENILASFMDKLNFSATDDTSSRVYADISELSATNAAPSSAPDDKDSSPFAGEDGQRQSDETDILLAVKAALAADKIITERKIEQAKIQAQEQKAKACDSSLIATEKEQLIESSGDEEYSKDGIKYIKSFDAKMILASDETKGYFAKIANSLLAFKKVKMRASWQYVTFKYGKNQLCRIAVRGKTLCVHFALPPEQADEKYFITDLSGVRKFAETPSMLKVKSERGVKYALELVDLLKQKFDLVGNPKFTEAVNVADYPPETIQSLIKRGLVKKVNENGEEITDEPDFAQNADLIACENPEQNNDLAAATTESLDSDSATFFNENTDELHSDNDECAKTIVCDGAEPEQSIDDSVTTDSATADDSVASPLPDGTLLDSTFGVTPVTKDEPPQEIETHDEHDEALSMADIALSVKAEENDIYHVDKIRQKTKAQQQFAAKNDEVNKNEQLGQATEKLPSSDKKTSLFSKVKRLFSKRR